MKKSMKLATLILIAMTCALFAQAQDHKLEIVPFFGYSFSSGIDVYPTEVDTGLFVDRISPVSGYSWGVDIQFLAGENFGFGFLYGEQDSALEGDYTTSGKVEFTDMKVRNYHGIFTYNMGDSDESMRPYVFGGIGATQYAPSDIDGYDIRSETKFSTTWGFGVKIYAGDHIGFRLQGRWTPTYIKSDADGMWCTPYYCWVLEDAKYSHQFELSAGVVIRF